MLPVKEYIDIIRYLPHDPLESSLHETNDSVP